MRLPGVLPRIAVCFFFGAILYLNLKGRDRVVLTLVLLIGYWAAMTFIPVPGYGPGVLDYNGNLAGYIDTRLLGGHLYKPEFDPEGLLSTIPAIATVLIGTLAGDWLRSSKTDFHKMQGIFGAGILLTAAGLLLHPVFPVNKQLWTSTFVLFTAGAALVVFGLCFLLMDRFKVTRWAYPFLVFGTNAITVFAGSILMVKILMMIKFADGGKTANPMSYLYAHVLSPLAGPHLGSLVFAVFLNVLWFFIIRPLYKQKIFLRV
jgi:predicted acyltransferase